MRLHPPPSQSAPGRTCCDACPVRARPPQNASGLLLPLHPPLVPLSVLFFHRRPPSLFFIILLDPPPLLLSLPPWPVLVAVRSLPPPIVAVWEKEKRTVRTRPLSPPPPSGNRTHRPIFLLRFGRILATDFDVLV